MTHRLLFLLTVLAQPTAAQTLQWFQRANNAPTNQQREWAQLVFDRARAETVLFGGVANSPAGAPSMNDTWTWNGSIWTQKSPATTPPARFGQGMAYDDARSRVVMFSGTGPNAPPFTSLSDTWLWNGTNWTQASPTTSPPGRNAGAMAYDEARQKVVLFGGVATINGTGNFFNGPNLDDTWEWDGTNWTQVTTATKPSPRAAATLAYDSKRQRIVLFGGMTNLNIIYPTMSNETWEYDGSNWTQITAPGTPMARMYHGMAFDKAFGRTVLFGGWGTTNYWLNDTWSWDGSCWRPEPVASMPAGRYRHSLAYDSVRNCSVMFGSWGNNPPNNWMTDTQELSLIGTYELSGAGCLGSCGVPKLVPLAPPRIGQTLSVGVRNLCSLSTVTMFLGNSDTVYRPIFPLPFDLTPFGMTGCTLYCSLESVVTQTAWNVVFNYPVPNNNALIGTTLFQQAFVTDPGANAAGLVATGLGTAILGL